MSVTWSPLPKQVSLALYNFAIIRVVQILGTMGIANFDWNLLLFSCWWRPSFITVPSEQKNVQQVMCHVAELGLTRASSSIVFGMLLW